MAAIERVHELISGLQRDTGDPCPVREIRVSQRLWERLVQETHALELCDEARGYVLSVDGTSIKVTWA